MAGREALIIMDKNILEIMDFTGEGYKPLVDYGTWRVAFLRYIDELHPARIKEMERHTLTDEVFVLLSGKAVLLLGGRGIKVPLIHPQILDFGKIYNVKQNVWHSILLSLDATVLIVENRNTGRDNSEYCQLSEVQRVLIKKAAVLLDPSIHITR
jgi:ureidoglycolate hydrolase